MLDFHVLTIFPDMFESPFSSGLISKAADNRLLKINCHDIRKYSTDSHKTVDDYPFGGGPGMVMKPEPIFLAVEDLQASNKIGDNSRIIVMSPQGRMFDKNIAKELTRYDELVLICGRYEGIDDRVVQNLADEELSIGNYILNGGELPAMVVIDAVSRLLPGVVGSEQSILEDSLSENLLKYPQYTRPRSFKGLDVPDVLLSGNHKIIEEWRKEKSIEKTNAKRPDLIPDKDV
ncbi:MAG: tRNA (guanosine(37)-N1)-methyltransferase TrmD [SAR202 cluster bacterium]|nr:tRNA (guanosine(37)-N1)-methyltransferase TrmD [SAR202 cluster bacterium]